MHLLTPFLSEVDDLRLSLNGHKKLLTRRTACPIVRTTMKTAADDIFSLQIFSDVLRTILKNFCSLLPVCNVSAPELLACSVLYTKSIERSKTGKGNSS
jgi:hypothetical protein